MAYTTEGSVRGTCGHTHRTIEAAYACAARDRAGCKPDMARAMISEAIEGESNE